MPNVSKCRKLSMPPLFSFLVLGDAAGVSDTNYKEESSLSSPKQIIHFINTLEHALTILKGMVNDHVFMNLVHSYISLPTIIFHPSVCFVTYHPWIVIINYNLVLYYKPTCVQES